MGALGEERLDELGIDLANRSLFTTPSGVPIEEAAIDAADEDTMAALEAYSAGVNAWIDDATNGENGASLSLEYSFAAIFVQSR